MMHGGIISIHSPLAGRDDCPLLKIAACWISIHSPLAGRDIFFGSLRCVIGYFNPLAPRGARPNATAALNRMKQISIHSPLAGRDAHLCPECGRKMIISIHSPLAGRD